MKYLEVPDFHFAPEWADIARGCAESIRQAAIHNKVDFIAVPGDLLDKTLFATDRSKYDVIQKIVKSWLDVCPVVAIQGTLSHDAPGCYGPFERMGLVLLQPNKVYGLFDSPFPDQEPFIADVHLYHYEDPNCILFGVPELNKSNIQAQLSLSAEAANAEAVNLFDQYLQEFVGPMRLKYKDIPAIGLLHGNVSDSRQENSTDIIMRSSDIIIHTEILEQANLDRWSLGHIHKPWESSRISAGYSGYPGIDHNPWGKRDFIPGFNMIEITDESSPRVHDIIRFPYGTPGRIKITEPQSVYLPNFAYWLETEDPDAILPEGLHPWSRITYTETTVETRRVTKEQAEKAKTLWDMFELIDPEVDTILKEKIDSIPIPRNSIAGNKLDAVLTSVSVKGCDLFGGKTVEFDLDNLATGMNQLIGTNGNGDGKSSLLGMCSLYPCVVGKDTKSGRRSALKDFFSGQDSSIQKTAIVNGQKHNHIITIKGAHTQNPKTECYLDIDGIPQLEKATFDTMMEKCEELYGNYEDYLLTTFYEQPQQSRNQRSGLMTATMTEARNLVQNIAGIDRESEKRYALDQVADCEKSEQQLTSDINALEKYSENIEELNSEFANKTAKIVFQNNDLEIIKTKGSMSKTIVGDLQIKHTENEKAKTQKTEVEKNINFVENAIFLSNNHIKKLNKSVQNLPANQAIIKKDEEAQKLETEYSTLLLEYNQVMNNYDKLVSQREGIKKDSLNIISNNEIMIKNIKKQNSDRLELEYSEAMNKYHLTMQKYNTAQIDQNNCKREHQGIIDNAEIKKQSYNKEIELISEPCENCGYIKPDVQIQIDDLNTRISLIDISIKEAFDSIEDLKPISEPNITKPVKVEFDTNDEIKELKKTIVSLQKDMDSLTAISKPEITEPIKPPESLSAFDREIIQEAITEGLKAETAIEGFEAGIIKDQNLLQVYNKDLAEIVIDNEIGNLLDAANNNLNITRKEYTDIKSNISTLEAEKKAIEDRIQKANESADNLKIKQNTLAATEANHIDWTYIAKMLNPDKIPALELDIILDSIDAEATRNIEPFLEGRYSYHTETQSQGKKTTVDKFDVLIHDAETGRSFSMFYTNPGNKAFYSDCYIKALIRKRNERQQRSYSPIIYDEADGPVNPIRVKAYYDIQQAYFQDEKVLIVSQKDISASYVEKIFNIEEMKS